MFLPASRDETGRTGDVDAFFGTRPSWVDLRLGDVHTVSVTGDVFDRVVLDLPAGVGHGALELLADDVGRIADQHRPLRGAASGRHLRRWLLEVHDACAQLGVAAFRDAERVAVARVEPLGDVT
jgi:hypothetical protein